VTVEFSEMITALATSVLALTAVAALGFTIIQLRRSRESDRIKHLLSFIHDFECDPIATVRRTVGEKFLAGEKYPVEAQNLLNFFETIGLLVRRKYLDINDVWSSFSYWMFYIYASFRDDIEQEQREDGTYYGDFCKLIERLRKIEKTKGCKDDRPSADEVRDFWEDEVKVVVGQPLRKRKPRKPRN
jgi:hypothetical protein